MAMSLQTEKGEPGTLNIRKYDSEEGNIKKVFIVAAKSLKNVLHVSTTEVLGQDFLATFPDISS